MFGSVRCDTLFRRASLIGILLLSYSGLALAQHREEGAPHWGYNGSAGPEHWGDLEKDFAACKEGRNQSPIDIRHAHKARLDPIEFHYRPAPLHIVNNGHTVMVEDGIGGWITVGGKRYDLVQFHFHHSSEERIHGKAYAMDAHLVHKDASGKLVVVAVLFKPGRENSLIHDLWAHLPQEAGKEYASEKEQINVARLLPGNHAYYTFSGSLTTPPCSEAVTWFVLRQPVEISGEEMKEFSKLYPANARPVQPLNGRTVLASR